MVNLKLLLDSHPNCLASRAALRSHLLNMFPGEKRPANILASIYECGISQKMQCMKVLTEHDVQMFVNQLEREYGISPKYAVEYIYAWSDALGVEYTSAPKESFASRRSSVTGGAPSDLVTYFENHGFEVVDKRKAGGCLWIIGEKAKLDPYVAHAKELFSIIDGGYAKGRATGGRHGWYTSSKK